MKSCENCFWAYNCYNPSEDWSGAAETCKKYSEIENQNTKVC